MDEQTALVLALQLVALLSIAGALLVYLLCKIKAGNNIECDENIPGGGKAVLITSVDNALGLQIALHLANKGFRVFAGLKEVGASGTLEDSTASKIIRAWDKNRESLVRKNQGALVTLPLDVTREDVLHEAVDIIRAHLPAGEDGIWAVINTSSTCYRGRLDQQDISHWDTMLKNNVIGLLRSARKFQGLLRNTSGRLFTCGHFGCTEDGLVAYTASRFAVEGASEALRQELAPMGIKVIVLKFPALPPEKLYATPKLCKATPTEDIAVNLEEIIEYQPIVLNSTALSTLDIAITSSNPKPSYLLTNKTPWFGRFGFVQTI